MKVGDTYKTHCKALNAKKAVKMIYLMPRTINLLSLIDRSFDPSAIQYDRSKISFYVAAKVLVFLTLT